MIARLRTIIAKRRLARMVERERLSFACEDYRRRRAAALRGMGRA